MFRENHTINFKLPKQLSIVMERLIEKEFEKIQSRMNKEIEVVPVSYKGESDPIRSAKTTTPKAPKPKHDQPRIKARPVNRIRQKPFFQEQPLRSNSEPGRVQELLL